MCMDFKLCVGFIISTFFSHLIKIGYVSDTQVMKAFDLQTSNVQVNQPFPKEIY